MYTVVLAVDQDDDPARHAASAVANLPGEHDDVEVYVFHCFLDNPHGASATQVPGVRAAVDELKGTGVTVNVTEASGDPPEAILDEAEELGADLIVVGGRKRSPAGKALFGSVTQSVILNADRPVMVTGEKDAE